MDLPRFHRLRTTFYRLGANRCLECGQVSFPPRMVCPGCGSTKAEALQLSGRGRVVSITRVYQPPRGFASSSTGVMALVELEEGVRVTAQITDVDPEQVSIGMEVEMVVRRLRAEEERGLIVYGYKFRPPIPESARAHEDMT